MPSPGIDDTPTNEGRTQILVHRCWFLQALAVDNLERQWGREMLLIGRVLGGALLCQKENCTLIRTYDDSCAVSSKKLGPLINYRRKFSGEVD